jgi:hypothetical protein
MPKQLKKVWVKTANSNGDYDLYIEVEHNMLWITFSGYYNGERIQFDFDGLKPDKAKKLLKMLKGKVKKMK